MTYDFLKYDGKAAISKKCFYDSYTGYKADFSINGDVDNWKTYVNIDTYGCWNGFLFGTLNSDQGYIGRSETFLPVPAEDFYFLTIHMKIDLTDRVGSQIVPTKGAVQWRTIADTIWDESKYQTFDLIPDGEWQTYSVDLASAQFWQGDVNDLRIFPICENGKDADEFFIKAIEIVSNNKSRCLNVSCSFYDNYTIDCAGIGLRGYCKSASLATVVSNGSRFDFAEELLYTIEEDVNDVLYININDYGLERVKVGAIAQVSGNRIAALLENEISKTDVGGYAECEVTYTDLGEFIIYSGVYTDDSTVLVGDSPLARTLHFYNNIGEDVSSRAVGQYPASGFKSNSSVKLKSYQLYNLLDNSETSDFYFNPYRYSVEGGRSDWLVSGLGSINSGNSSSAERVPVRYYNYISNAGRTVVDFTHPFNASGRINKIYAAVTLDVSASRGAYESNRIATQLSGAKIVFFRPDREGNLKLLSFSVPIEDRDFDNNRLYSSIQEYVELDCDVIVNKGDLIGVYNANVYSGRSALHSEVDALYYSFEGLPTEEQVVRQPIGDGSGGLLLYAVSEQTQSKLVVDIDLGKRVNIDNVYIDGEVTTDTLDYNIASCLDMNWDIDLFDGDFTTYYVQDIGYLLQPQYCNHPTVYYGKDKLNDGIKIAPAGLAAESFSVESGAVYSSYEDAIHKKDGGKGVILSGPKYFCTNGDSEWLDVYLHVGTNIYSQTAMPDFEHDPIALTLFFPNNREKLLYRSTIYFKEKDNFRSFAQSLYKGPFYGNGDADDNRFDLIDYRLDGTNTPWTRLRLDGIEYTPENDYTWSKVDLSLAQNPCVGHAIKDYTGGSSFKVTNMDQWQQALLNDWNIIDFEWAPDRAQGYRFYCDYHRSTKICEFEVYAVLEKGTSTFSSAIDVRYSSYGDVWWPSTNTVMSEGIQSFIGDSPKYIELTIKPLTEIKCSNLEIDISYGDVFSGKKGCQYTVLPIEAKTGRENESSVVSFKNVYGAPYDLYVDIAANAANYRSTVFYSKLNNAESITNPIIGPDAYYRKQADYALSNTQKNVAINCPVFALKSLTDGAQAWYTHDNEYSWKYWGQLSDGQSVDFSNLPSTSITTINFPVFVRSKWWKIGFLDQRMSGIVKEIQFYYEDEEIFNVNFYNEENKNVYTSPNIDRAPHLNNNIVDGSYYIMRKDQEIGFEFDSIRSFDKIVMYTGFKEMYENSHDLAGIDSSTSLCIQGEGILFSNDIRDVSYYEHDIQVGAGIYYDTGYEDMSYSFTEDFSDCEYVSDLFTKNIIDSNIWSNPVNASIDSSRLRLTNSGTIGEVTTVYTFNNDFDVRVDLEVIDEDTILGWGGFLTVINTTNTPLVRVGRTYTLEHGHTFIAQSYDGTDWQEDGFNSTADVNSLKLRLTRVDDLLTYYSYDHSEVWYEMGTTVVSGIDPVKFKLSSDMTPTTSGITTALFDTFKTTLKRSDWGMGTGYGSTYTCVSGVNPTISGGYALQYEIRGNRNRSEDTTYKIPQIFERQSKPIDQDFEFTLDFVINMTEFLDVNGNSSNADGISVGLLGFHTHNSYYLTYSWLPFFTGAQVIFKRDDIGIAIKSDFNDSTSGYDPPNNISSHVSFDSTASIYFCRFTHDGAGNYNVIVWSDDFDGTVQVVDHSLYTTYKWEVGRIGVGAASNYTTYGTYYWTYSPASYSRGWISNINFTSSKRSYNRVIGNSAIRFSGISNEKLLIDWNNSSNCNVNIDTFDISSKQFTFDFFIKFNTLPVNDGDYVEIISCWDENQAFNSGSTIYTNSSWAFILQRVSGAYRWRFYANIGNRVIRILDDPYHPDPQRWYHFYLGRGATLSRGWCFLKDGHSLTNGYDNGTGSFMDTFVKKEQNVVVGKNLDGWLYQLRMSADYTDGGNRIESYSHEYRSKSKDLPIAQYEKYYTFSLYNSTDNVSYGKHMDVDVLFNNSYSYHEPFGEWCETYDTYFAIDFGQRHDVGIVRSYPVDSAYSFNVTDNILYSNTETDDPRTAFILSDEQKLLDSDFSGTDYDYPSKWTKVDDIHTDSYILNNKFCQSVWDTTGDVSSRAKFKAYFKGDFDIQINYNFISETIDNNTWLCGFEIQDINNVNNAIKFERGYLDWNIYKWSVKDSSTSWVQVASRTTLDSNATIRLTRDNDDFSAYTKNVEDAFEDFNLFSNYRATNGFGKEVQLELYTEVSGPDYPDTQVWWTDFVVNVAVPIYSSSNDARWMRVKLLNGDGVTKTIKKVEVFPDISVQSSVSGQYNNYWTPLGTAITSYAEDDNIALGCTVSGSSEVGIMELYRVTDGIINDGDLNSCWGGEEELPQWVTISLNEVTDIYRVIIYHGYNTERADTIIQDYNIQSSIDNITFTTLFTITGNTSFKRTHDLSTPVSAKYIRIYITKYIATEKFVWESDSIGSRFWAGPVLREVEIFKYYDFTSINSEDTPIIAIDLQDRFFIESYEFVGMDTEDDTDDWEDNDVELTYSNSDLTNPDKINFKPWGSVSTYDRWALFKNDIATKYPTADDTPKYLKHVIVKAVVNENGEVPNPVTYPWMWRSTTSELSYDYDKVVDGFTVDRSLKIDYNAGTNIDHVYFIEGDNFGYADTISWRDGFGLFLYIDDLNNMDLSYGNIYLGGWDSTPQNNPVIYKWSFATISGSLQSGWNNLILTLSRADEVEYTENTNYGDPRRPYTIKWGKMGLTYRGIGNPLQINIYGCWLSRNHFEHGCYKDYGLYLQADDMLKINVGEIDLHSGAIGFWIRPDWNFDGRDIYDDFKFRALFHITNVANDVFGAMVTNEGLEIYFGNLIEDLTTLIVKDIDYEVIDNVIHMGFVFSNDGSSIDSDRSTVRFYINNNLIAKSTTTWVINDNKHFNIIFGGKGLLGPKLRVNEPITSSVDGVLSRLKIYNYCKTNFSDSIGETETTDIKELIDPSQLIEISKNNLTFYKIGDSELPLVYTDVEDDEVISVYTRVVLPDHKLLTGFEKRTAHIIGSWDIGV